MSVITQAKETPRGKSVLLYSGGMDSLCFSYLCKPNVLLAVPTGAKYTSREQRCLQELADRDYFFGAAFVHLPNVLDLSRYERDDLIVPNRNAHLILLASHYGETIWLGSVAGDRSCDKDEGFYARMDLLLDHMWQPQHWTERRSFTVESPFKTITKTALVREYLRHGGPAEALLVSYSCYEGEDDHCGVCKPCARKRVALENNGIIAPAGYWRGDFRQAAWFATVLPSMQEGRYRGEEDFDFARWLHNAR